MALIFSLIAGPLAAWLAPAAYAQGGALTGTVFDLDGKPYPDVTLTITNIETNKATEAKTDDKGKYSVAGLGGGKFNVDFKAKDKDGNPQLIWQAGLQITAGTSPTYDVNLKDLKAAGKLAAIEAIASRAEAEKQFQNMKTHYDAGLAAIDQMKAAQAELAKTPKEQQDPVKEKINQAGGTAVTELSAALQAMKADDANRSIVLSRLGEAYESMNKWQEAADTYQKSIALKPDMAANYNNLGNDLAKLGKVDDARAAYQKYVDLNPTDAALAWRNFGTVLYNSNRMKEAIDPLQKATTLDPKNATAWLLLGIALVNTMQFKTEGDKITPVIQPGTVEAYQHAIDLDPNGPIGAQAKQGLDSLQAMGVGITTKIGQAPSKAQPKGKKTQ
ncbi:MAG TPA: tetratricopeptide repeat protein [Candidatus Acidoferrales bacterium]|nr:tetratricopeptide repeat protein [Candidatus Acidoferrales bacterium]